MKIFTPATSSKNVGKALAIFEPSTTAADRMYFLNARTQQAFFILSACGRRYQIRTRGSTMWLGHIIKKLKLYDECCDQIFLSDEQIFKGIMHLQNLELSLSLVRSYWNFHTICKIEKKTLIVPEFFSI